jgi:hypothetical protein
LIRRLFGVKGAGKTGLRTRPGKNARHRIRTIPLPRKPERQSTT